MACVGIKPVQRRAESRFGQVASWHLHLNIELGPGTSELAESDNNTE